MPEQEVVSPDAFAPDEAVKILCQQIGVKRTAELTGIAYSTLNKRCWRGGWLKETNGKPKTPSEILRAEMKEHSERTRLGLARGLVKAAETVEEMDGQEVLQLSQNVQQIAKAAGTVHGWEAKTQQSISLRLDMIAQPIDNRELEAIDAEFSEGLLEDAD